MAILPIAYYGDPVLRQKTQKIEEINDEIRQLVDDMIETMYENNGMGLAGPQVFRSLAIFIVCYPYEDEEGETKFTKPKVFINPKLSEPSEEKWEYDEGCLSLPKLMCSVNRPYSITVEYTNMEGERLTERFSHWEARPIMHENDHLNGVLTFDRTDQKNRKNIEPELQKLKKMTIERRKKEKKRKK
jgi:peptide deformylase